jgi:hypothetical protein
LSFDIPWPVSGRKWPSDVYKWEIWRMHGSNRSKKVSGIGTAAQIAEEVCVAVKGEGASTR